GRVATDTITVTYDLTAPVLTITGPTSASTFQTSAASIALAGTSSDNLTMNKVEWRIDGGAWQATAGATSSWSVAAVALSAGAHTIDVLATDTAGNTTQKSLAVTRDTTIPLVDIVTPDNSVTYKTNSSSVV